MTWYRCDGNGEVFEAEVRPSGLPKTRSGCKPVVVLSADPDDLDLRGAVAYLRESGLFNGTARAIEDQLPPPKPEEPQGLGAVVEDENGIRYSRIGRKSGCWLRDDGGLSGCVWDEIAAVRVLSPGVTS